MEITARKRFWAKVKKGSGCWEWTGAKRSNGYGSFKIRKKCFLPHRLSYEEFFGSIPDRALVCHKCDNPGCVRPTHLFLGTQSDNMKDCFKKGRLKIPNGSRFESGNKPLNRRLSDSEAREIRDRLAKGDKPSHIAKENGIPIHIIKDISAGRTYSTV